MSTVRQRKNGSSEEKVPLTSSPDEIKSNTTATTSVKGLSIATIQNALYQCAPYARTVQSACEMAVPYFNMIGQKYGQVVVFLAPYRVDLLIPAFAGFVLCFFGGYYVTLIAAVEAYRMCGYEQSVKCLNDLSTDWKAFSEANAKDNTKDDDNDGVADVHQIDAQQLATRKTLLFLKTVDPHRLSSAIGGLNTGLLAVIATLKLQFAKAITLGNALGDIAEKPANSFLIPALESVIPSEYKKWAAPMVTYAVKSMCISVAWFLQRILSAIHSAIRGGTMVSRNMLEYASKMGYFHIDHEETQLDEIVGAVLAASGLWFQLSTGFQVPFPLNIILLPFTILEYVLLWLVAGGK